MFGHREFLQAWQIACEAAKPLDITLAGPNVSDFEPVFNLALFIERVVEPEAFDHRALGRWLEQSLALNLIKKARILQAIGRSFGVDKTCCTYNTWTIKRLARRAVEPVQKQADHLVSYCVLAAASSALGKVYWGSLFCSRDGLIVWCNE